jgi:hypothetical protein
MVKLTLFYLNNQIARDLRQSIWHWLTQIIRAIRRKAREKQGPINNKDMFHKRNNTILDNGGSLTALTKKTYKTCKRESHRINKK